MDKQSYLEEIYQSAIDDELEKFAGAKVKAGGGILKRLWTPLTQNKEVTEAAKKALELRKTRIAQTAVGSQRKADKTLDSFISSMRAEAKASGKVQKKSNPGFLKKILTTKGQRERGLVKAKQKHTESVLNMGQAEARQLKSKANLYRMSETVDKRTGNALSRYAKATRGERLKGSANALWRTALVGGPTAAIATPIIKKKTEPMRARYKAKKQMKAYRKAMANR